MDKQQSAAMPKNGEIFSQSRRELSGDWGAVVLCTLAVTAISSVASGASLLKRMVPDISASTQLWASLAMMAVALLVAMPLGFGYANTFLQMLRGERSNPTTSAFSVFGKGYGRWLGSSLLYMVLLVVPMIIISSIGVSVAAGVMMAKAMAGEQMSMGLYLLILLAFMAVGLVPLVIAYYRLVFTPFVLHDNPDLSVIKGMKQSARMLKGYRMRLFLLDLRFIGLIVLSIATLGIATLWVQPWQAMAHATFYNHLRALQAE